MLSKVCKKMKINESNKSKPTLKISFLMAMADKFLENIGFTGIINNQTDEGSKSRYNLDTGSLIPFENKSSYDMLK